MKRNSNIGAIAVFGNCSKLRNAENLLGIKFGGEMWRELIRENARRVEAARQKVIHAINHQSYDDLSEIAQLLKENKRTFSIVTRTTLQQEFSRQGNRRILVAAKLIDNEGAQEAMLYLLGAVRYSYVSLQPLRRFSQQYLNFKNVKP